MPSLDAGGIVEALAHEHRLQGDVFPVGMRLGQRSGHPERAGHNLGRVEDVLIHGLLEEVGRENRPQNGLDFVVVLDEDLADCPDGLGVARRLNRPCGDLRLVLDEEVVEMARDEDVARGLPDDDVYDVETVELAGVPQVVLLGTVMVLGVELVVPQVGAPEEPVDLGVEGPAGEGAGGLVDVLFGVVADTQGEELHELAAPVLVGRSLVVLLVVEPVEHRRVLRQSDEEVAVVAEAVLAEHADLVLNLIGALDLVVACGEDLVPEQPHLLL